MTDRAVSELLERLASRTPVGPAPLERIFESAARRRRRRRLVRGSVGAAGLAAAAMLLAVTVGGSVADAPPPKPSVAGPSVVAAPATMRFVGLRDVAVAVPVSWGSNELRCGTPVRDTVVMDLGAVPACLWPRPRGIETVSVAPVRPGQTGSRGGYPAVDGDAPGRGRVTEITVDGVPAQRSGTTCAPEGSKRVVVCAATVVVPSRQVVVTATSSTSRAEVDRALARIAIVPGHAGVPGYSDVKAADQGDAAQAYAGILREHGLAVQVRTRRVGGGDPGFMLDASPRPGTMLPKGGVVSITVIAQPEGPADEVNVGISSMDRKHNYRSLTDEQIRAGASLTLKVGDLVWAYAKGNRSSTLAGRLDGAALAVDDWKQGPNYPHSWEAVASGRTKITLTITAAGEPVVLGVVTVIVKS